MRPVSEQGLQLAIFHELRRRLAHLEGDDLSEERAVQILIETLDQIPGLQASIDDEKHLQIHTGAGTYHFSVQNIVDGLCLLWNEFRESQVLK